MAGVLISGPAGGGKSQAARDAANAVPGPAVIVDFTAIYTALTLQQRGPDGRYPDRGDGDGLLPLTESIRQRTILTAVERDVTVIATNSDGRADRPRLPARGYSGRVLSSA